MKLRTTLITFAIVCGVSTLSAADPSWWSTGTPPVVDPSDEANNYAPANLGQLKHVSKRARQHLEDNLFGGAGEEIDTLIGSFQPPIGGFTSQQIATNYAPLNLGQLKRVAKPFYDRLIEVHYDTRANLIARGIGSWPINNPYPWDPETDIADNYAPANLGQLKMVFSFDVSDFDSDGDGLIDLWEMEHFGSLGYDDEEDPDGDGLSNADELASGSDPDNYYSQGSETIVPFLIVISGDNQQAAVGQYLPQPLKVEVRNGASSGPLLVGAPITFIAETGGSSFAAQESEWNPASPAVMLSGLDGVASAFCQLGSGENITSTISAQGGGSTKVYFHTLALDSLFTIGHWKFNEGTGNIAGDSGPFNHSGTLEESPQWSIRQTGENCLSFSGKVLLGGSDDYVSIGDTSDRVFDFATENFSIVAWVKFDAEIPEARIAGKGNISGETGYKLGITDEGKIEASIGTTDTGSNQKLAVETSDEFDDSEWHHVVLVVDREYSTLAIFVDGQPQILEKQVGSGGYVDSEYPETAVFDDLTHLSASATGSSLTIASSEGTDDFFKGMIDEVRICRVALSYSDVLDLYADSGRISAVSGYLSVDEDTMGTIALTSRGVGSASASYEIIAQPSNGEVELTGNIAKFYPNAHFSGTDSFRFKVTSGTDVSEAKIAVTINAIGDAPLVNAGGAKVLTLPAVLVLNGTVNDIDSEPEEISAKWSNVSGSGAVTFDDAESPTTSVSFAAPGEYLLRLSANDGSSLRSDTVLVVVNAIGSTNLPSIVWQSPADNSSFEANQNVPLEITVAAASGRQIEEVAFYEGSRLIGKLQEAVGGSFALNWNSSRLGVYGVSAVVTDSTGAKSVSSQRVVRMTESDWFSPGSGGDISGPGNEGYAGSGGNGGAISGSATGSISGLGAGSGANGGGAVAGGGGDGFGLGIEGGSFDTDDDGISNQQEIGLGMDPLNSDPEQNSDTDNIPDIFDAAPLDGSIAWERTPESRYAFVPIKGATKNYEFLAVGKNGSVLAAVWDAKGEYVNGLKVWKDGKWSPLNLSIPIVHTVDINSSIYGYHRSKTVGTFPISLNHSMITDAGDIYVSGEFEFPEFKGTPYEYTYLKFGAKWVAGAGEAISSYLPKEIHTVDYSTTPPIGVSHEYREYKNYSAIVARSGNMQTQEFSSEYTRDSPSQGVSTESVITRVPGNEFVYSRQANGNVTGLNFQLWAVTRSGHSVLFRGFYTRRFTSGNYSEESATSAASLGETPNGDAMLSFSGKMRIRTAGEWLSTKQPLPGYLNKKGEGIQYTSSGAQLWRNGSWKALSKFTNDEDDNIRFTASPVNGLTEEGVVLAHSGAKGPGLFVPVEILEPRLDAQGNDTGELKGTDDLKVAQWEHAWKTDGTPYGELLDGFIDLDPDRFYLRVPLVGSSSKIKVKVSTVDAGENTIDEWKEIEMEVDPENSGYLKSKSQLLVADDPDKNAAGAINSKEIAPRMHKISLFGKLKVRLQIGDASNDLELQVPAVGKQKSVTVHARILRDQPGGAPAATEAYVWNDLINNVKPRYAQANIVVFVGSVVTVDPPNGVDLSNGLALAQPGNIPLEVKALADGLGTPSADDIYIFYVPSITVPSGGGTGGRGFAIVDAYYPETANRPYIYNAFIGVSQMNFLTTAHEIGHLLTNYDHIEGNPAPGGGELMYFQRNLMFGGTYMAPREFSGSIYDSKRLWNSQIDVIRKNDHVK